ncbi:RraA family protein [Glycocaulis profundi]|nr:RraA family protein [Glycocaulis profundi]
MNQPVFTCDLCDAHPERVRVLAPVFSSFGGRRAFFGPVETVQAHEDNSMVREAVAEAGAGRVLAVDGGGSLKRSLLGGDLAALAASNGWAGVIVNGAVRDAHELETADLGVLALGLIPMKTEKRGRGARGLTVCLGGVPIRPGDWIYADRDGVLAAEGPLHEQ